MKTDTQRADFSGSLLMPFVGASIWLAGVAVLIGGMAAVAILVTDPAIQEGNLVFRLIPTAVIGIMATLGVSLLSLGTVTLVGVGPIAGNLSQQDKKD